MCARRIMSAARPSPRPRARMPDPVSLSRHGPGSGVVLHGRGASTVRSRNRPTLPGENRGAVQVRRWDVPTAHACTAVGPAPVKRRTSAGTGRVVSVDQHLNGPLGLGITPRGTILTVNSGDGKIVETTRAGRPGGRAHARQERHPARGGRAVQARDRHEARPGLLRGRRDQHAQPAEPPLNHRPGAGSALTGTGGVSPGPADGATCHGLRPGAPRTPGAPGGRHASAQTPAVVHGMGAEPGPVGQPGQATPIWPKKLWLSQNRNSSSMVP
jgi:hypothetical protein